METKKTPEFSVLLSIYYKEKPAYFDRCLESLVNQTVKADEWVIVKDGAIPDELQAVIDKYKAMPDVNIKEVALEKNSGLGIALSYGVPACSHELIARMDSDDISVPERFEIQLAAFETNPDIDICGGQITEFDTDENIVIGERHVPLTHDEIAKYQRKRCAFNHTTVMFKKSSVLKAGNYKDVPLMEDDMLWADMLMSGAQCMNLPNFLCKVRTDKTMIARRGGLKYYKKYKSARKKIYKLGFISYGCYLKTNIIQFAVCIMPACMRKFLFFHVLHKKTNDKTKNG